MRWFMGFATVAKLFTHTHTLQAHAYEQTRKKSTKAQQHQADVGEKARILSMQTD